MRLAKLSVPALVTAAMVAVAASAHADPDADFTNQLHGDGIYGPLDYNAWLGKITCERLHNDLDTTADKSADFALINLPRGTTAAKASPPQTRWRSCAGTRPSAGRRMTRRRSRAKDSPPISRTV